MVLGILFPKGVVEKIGDGFPKNRLRGKNREQKPEKPASWKKLRAKIRKIRQDGKNTKIVSKPSTFAKQFKSEPYANRRRVRVCCFSE